jgi:hypothetical protein
MFNDVKEDGKFTLSFAMATSEKKYKYVNPEIGDVSYRLRIRFDLNKRSAVKYKTSLPGNIDIQKEFNNVTLPYCNNTENKVSIILPKEVIKIFCKEINVDYPKGYDVTWEDLQWMNKTRLPIEKARREMYICHYVKHHYYNIKYDLDNEKEWLKIHSHIKEGEESRKESRKRSEELIKKGLEEIKKPRRIYNLYRKHLIEGTETEKYKKEIFDFLLKRNDITMEIIPKKLIKDYWEHPYALEMAKEHHYHVKNIDRRRNLIKNVKKAFYEEKPYTHRHGIQILNGHYYGTGREEFGDINALDTLGKVFNEEEIYRKLLDSHRFDLLVDTAKNINEIRLKGYDFKTKGSIKKLHSRSSAYLSNLNLSSKEFNNVKNIKDIKLDKDGLINARYARSEKELGMIGNSLKNCVTGYGPSCYRGNTQIVYIEENNKIEACLEISMYKYSLDLGQVRIRNLVQAKGYNNNGLSSKMQKYIKEFCLKEEICISTRDIKSKINREVNEKLDLDSKMKKAS